MRRRTLLLHLLRIVIAYLAAALAGGLLVSVAFNGITPVGFETANEHILLTFKTGIWGFAPLIAGYIAPAALGLAAIGEYLRLRNPVVYVAAAALVSVAMAIAFLDGITGMAIAIYAGAGGLGGLIYWAIAGRHAGLRRARTT